MLAVFLILATSLRATKGHRYGPLDLFMKYKTETRQKFISILTFSTFFFNPIHSIAPLFEERAEGNEVTTRSHPRSNGITHSEMENQDASFHQN